MRKINLPESIEVHVSEDIQHEMTQLFDVHTDQDIKEHIESRVFSFTDDLDEHERAYLKLYSRNRKTACLFAHGTTVQGHWVFYDSDTLLKVQDWIAMHEKRYGILILICCNPGCHTPTSSKSLLVLPDSVYSGLRASSDLAHVDLIHPKKGELGPVIEYELGLLKTRTASRV